MIHLATRGLSVSALLAACLLAMPAGTAHAFQNPARFLEDAAESGGGGQRFFTGSPADPYTCKVCHAPGKPVHVDVAGLPLHGYTPGATYTFTIDWPDDLKAVGLNVEITDAAGAAAGELSVPAVAQLTAADLCSAGSQSGAGVLPMDKRAVAVVGECGQHQTTMVWKAPGAPGIVAANSGTDNSVWFTGSLVVSDGNSDLAGDRVTDMRRALPMVGGADPSATRIGAAVCQLRHGPGAVEPHVLPSMCMLALWLVWRRRTRTSR